MINLLKDYGVLEKFLEESTEKIDSEEVLYLIVLYLEELVVDQPAAIFYKDYVQVLKNWNHKDLSLKYLVEDYKPLLDK